jgi:hypothetical protein
VKAGMRIKGETIEQEIEKKNKDHKASWEIGMSELTGLKGLCLGDREKQTGSCPDLYYLLCHFQPTGVCVFVIPISPFPVSTKKGGID